MAGSINRVVLVGSLGADPEIKTMQAGGKIANLNIATSEQWTDKTTGEKKKLTEWHRAVIFNGGLAEVAEKYLHKGSKVYVEGSLKTRKWTDTSGVEKRVTEVVITQFKGELVLLDGNKTERAETKKVETQDTEENPDDEIPFN